MAYDADNVAHSMHSVIGGGVASLGLSLLVVARRSNADSFARAAVAGAGAREDVLRETVASLRSQRDDARDELADAEITLQGLRNQIATLRRDKLAALARETRLMMEISQLRETNAQLAEINQDWADVLEELAA
jgi:chromosome segregation ATPase